MTVATRAGCLERGFRTRPAQTAGWGTAGGGAATAFPEATEAALEILRAGGNAVDAAVAAAWALGVCEPSGSGLGGQTTLLVYRPDGSVRIIDGHSYAPAAASLTTINPSQQRRGHRACTIPSTPATLAYAQRKYGILSESDVLAPAIRIAEGGYAITSLQHRQIRRVINDLRASAATSDLFLTNGQPPSVGQLFRQRRLAETLQRMGAEGVEDFYRGGMARAIVEDMRRHGGLLSAEDLESCTLPVEREPLSVSYRGRRIVTAPPPAGGLQLLLALRIAQGLLPSDGSFDQAEWYKAMALTVYATFRDREKWPLGPEDLAPSTIGPMLSEEHVHQVVREIREGTIAGQDMFAGEGPGDTTHLTVADRAGSVVALTQSIQSIFGAKVAHPELGFVYNNYLCTCPRRPHPFGLSGQCQPRSNAAPTLVLQEGSRGYVPRLALGAAGSRRITSSILQVIGSVVDRGMTVEDAVSAPRVHALLSGKVWIEGPAARSEVVGALTEQFPTVQVLPPRDYKLGAVQALEWTLDGCLRGAADPRRDGLAVVC